MKNSFIAEAIKKIGIKKAISVFVITLLILLPTVLAIINIIHTNNEIIISTADRSSVILLDDTGKELFKDSAVDEGIEGEDLLEIFKSLHDNMKKISSPSENVQTEKPLIAQLYLNNTTITLTCYFSFTEGASYCVDGVGEYYGIATSDSEWFLSSKYAQSLYSEAVPPTLSTFDGDTIIPSGVEWNYKNTAGSFIPSTLFTTTSGRKIYNITGGISLSFDRKPDYSLVTITDGSTKLFEGSFDELAYVTLESNLLLNISIHATWGKMDSAQSYGNIQYNFKVIINKRAEFSLDAESLAPADFALLKVTNVADISKLIFSSEQSDFIPNFYLEGEDAYAIIPYPSDVIADTYDFKVSYGVSTKSFSLVLKDTQIPTANQIIAATNALGVDFEKSHNLTNKYSFLYSSSALPEAKDFCKLSSFGNEGIFGDHYYKLPLSQYMCEDGSGKPVVACFGGQVVYVGYNSALGKYIIIDIGFGIKI